MSVTENVKDSAIFNPMTFIWMLNPWLSNQFMQTWLHTQQNALINSWEIALWQQITLQKILLESTRCFMHCIEVSAKPNTLYRYLRMNWLKPYEAFATHSVATTRLTSHMWIQTLSAWQDGWKRVTRVD